MGDEKTRYTLYIKKTNREALKILSKKTRVPISNYVDEAIEDLIAKYESPGEEVITSDSKE